MLSCPLMEMLMVVHQAIWLKQECLQLVFGVNVSKNIDSPNSDFVYVW
jgi:hypothetical protein